MLTAIEDPRTCSDEATSAEEEVGSCAFTGGSSFGTGDGGTEASFGGRVDLTSMTTGGGGGLSTVGDRGDEVDTESDFESGIAEETLRDTGEIGCGMPSLVVKIIRTRVPRDALG